MPSCFIWTEAVRRLRSVGRGMVILQKRVAGRGTKAHSTASRRARSGRRRAWGGDNPCHQQPGIAASQRRFPRQGQAHRCSLVSGGNRVEGPLRRRCGNFARYRFAKCASAWTFAGRRSEGPRVRSRTVAWRAMITQPMAMSARREGLRKQLETASALIERSEKRQETSRRRRAQ